MNRRKPRYLVYRATTPVDPEVRAAMLPFLDDLFGNPLPQHRIGWEAAAAVEDAHRAVADLISAAPDEILFTAGTTEAIVLSLLGAAPRTQSRHILVPL